MFRVLRRWIRTLAWSRLLPAVPIALFIGGIAIAVAGMRAGPTGGATFVPSSVSTVVPSVTAIARTGVERPRVQLTDSVPVRIRIPAINVDAQVAEVGKNPDGTVAMPPLADHNLAAWYKYSAVPGQVGAAVIAGHVDSFTGPSVFFNLKYLRRGQRIYITLADRRQAVFVVNTVLEAAKARFPTSSVYGALPYPGLRLITCGGPFDAGTGHYLDNIIVYASLVNAARGGGGLG